MQEPDEDFQPARLDDLIAPFLSEVESVVSTPDRIALFEVLARGLSDEPDERPSLSEIRDVLSRVRAGLVDVPVAVIVPTNTAIERRRSAGLMGYAAVERVLNTDLRVALDGNGRGDRIKLYGHTLFLVLACGDAGPGAREPGAVEVFDGGFRVTEVGRRWIAEGTARVWEHVTFEVQHDPVRDTLEWWVRESSVGEREVWTLDLPRVGDERVIDHLSELNRLVRDEGLPDDDERGKGNARPKVELRHAAIISRRLHWREVRVAFWEHALSGEVRMVGSIGGAEHPALTALLTGLVADHRRRHVGQAA